MRNPLETIASNRISSNRGNNNARQRSLRFEKCEDRRMLATMADIVFLVDESGTEQNTQAQEWLTELVTGIDVNGNGDRTDNGDVLSLAEQLDAAGVEDVQYGLVGFGETLNAGDSDETNDDIVRYAHSQLMIAGDSSSLFIDADPAGSDGIVGTGDDLTTADLNTIFSTNLEEEGGFEDGWDAVEHAISEYEIRDGAVPIFVLLQGDEGRIEFNDTPGATAGPTSSAASVLGFDALAV